MRVDIWSDVVCPWCYVGKRRFESALAGFEHGEDVEVTWRSFELDPGAPSRRAGDPVERLASKYGMTRAEAVAAQDNLTALAAGEGLAFRLARTQSGNTFDAHRLLHLAADRGRQGALKERLMAGYFTEGAPIGDHDTLVRLAAEAGLEPDECLAVLESDKYADDVRADEEQASDLGISGVPFFMVDGTYAISGAQPADLMLKVLRRAWTAAHPLVTLDGTSGAGPSCEGDACTV